MSAIVARDWISHACITRQNYHKLEKAKINAISVDCHKMNADFSTECQKNVHILNKTFIVNNSCCTGSI